MRKRVRERKGCGAHAHGGHREGTGREGTGKEGVWKRKEGEKVFFADVQSVQQRVPPAVTANYLRQLRARAQSCH